MTSSDRVHEIDGLRALAMSMVIAQHFGLLPFGWTGVWLFYVISGYVISRTFFLSELSVKVGFSNKAADYARFMLRRAFRIVPVYLLYLFVALLALTLTESQRDVAAKSADLPYLLTFTYNWQMIFNLSPVPDRTSLFGHLWTLSCRGTILYRIPAARAVSTEAYIRQSRARVDRCRAIAAGSVFGGTRANGL
jgi:peptidoglycan/LPS O-acetylase OafA/YrhL